MHKTFIQLSCLLIIGGLVLSACNLPVENATAEALPPTEPPATSTTEPTATPTEIPFTETPAATATETPTPEPSATATPQVVTARVGRESNCRVGPGGMYNLVATYQDGQMLEIVARDLGGGYIFTRNPEKPEEQCYLLANNVTITGDISILPKYTPLPSPTAAPYFEVAYKKFDVCKGDDFVLFTVENTGNFAFRSAYVRVVDKKVGQSVEHVLSAFDLMTGCIVAINVAPLEPGASAHLHSPPLKWNARGNTLQAVFQLCTEKALKGTCVIRTIEFSE